MARPRKDPTDPKWADVEIKPGPIVEVPAPNNDDQLLATLMAGFIARGGPISYDAMLRQSRELVEMIKNRS